MRTYLLPIVLLLSVSACQYTGRSAKNNISTGTYEFKTDSLRQDLNIDSVKEDRIRFSYSIDVPNDTGMMIGGNAYHTPVINTPKDRDEKGNEYEVNQYVYQNGNCAVLIRISKDTSKIAQVIATNCESLYHKRSMNSAGVLKLKKSE
ncbi:MAG: hypothetical protein JSS82_01780 [Bacteroidetes bacterium]|nr:hypothetical protein [Bacteroidota bacterium]